MNDGMSNGRVVPLSDIIATTACCSPDHPNPISQRYTPHTTSKSTYRREQPRIRPDHQRHRPERYLRQSAGRTGVFHLVDEETEDDEVGDGGEGGVYRGRFEVVSENSEIALDSEVLTVNRFVPEMVRPNPTPINQHLSSKSNTPFSMQLPPLTRSPPPHSTQKQTHTPQTPPPPRFSSPPAVSAPISPSDSSFRLRIL